MSDLWRPLISRDEWLLDPDVTFLNHGSFGAVPRTLMSQQRRLRDLMEHNPSHFFTFELPMGLRAAANRLASFVGGFGSDYVFVENATAGCNSVLASIRLGPGDEILVTNHCYPAVLKAAKFYASRSGATVVEAEVPFPLNDETYVTEAVASKLSSRTRLVILDHVTSPTAIVFPVRELTALCHNAGAQVLIDGAHAPGMLSLDIPSIDADWYVGNCHKWLMAPKGSGFLWVSSARQLEIHPLVISHGFGLGFTSEFDWVGTRDPTAWLAIPAAIDFHLRIGGQCLRERNVLLAQQGARELAGRWKTELGSTIISAAAMATVRTPTIGEATPESALKLREFLLKDCRIDVVVIAFARSLWVRISAQAYNTFDDYNRLAEVMSALWSRSPSRPRT